jgi:hypothetical protein
MFVVVYLATLSDTYVTCTAAAAPLLLVTAGYVSAAFMSARQQTRRDYIYFLKLHCVPRKLTESQLQ